MRTAAFVFCCVLSMAVWSVGYLAVVAWLWRA